MDQPLLSAASRLSDQELLDRISALAHEERVATAALVAHLAVLDERRLYLREGCSSLFTYCTRVLHLSENAAYRRVEAARVARSYPVVLDMLADGSISLTTVRLLAPELTLNNYHGLLEASRNRTTREVEKIVAGLRPQPLVPSLIRRVAVRAAGLIPAAPTTDVPRGDAGAIRFELTAARPEGDAAEADVDAARADIAAAGGQAMPGKQPALEIRPPTKSVIAVLTPTHFKIQFTASEETHDLLRRAQDLLRHQIPDGDVGEVMAKALSVLVRELEKERLAATDRPRGGRSTAPHSRAIPAEVTRQVWARDGGRCAYVAPHGRRCAEQAFLEFHHKQPYAAGGKATVENIELRCRAHNDYEAELFFGRRWPLTVGESTSTWSSSFGPSPSARARGRDRSTRPPPAP